LATDKRHREYAAFISYSHADRRWASWLHKRIESYRLPAVLIGRDSPLGPLPRRLSPVFLDREEIPATTDLGDAVLTALQHAHALIVVCSPSAVASRWVNEEIRRFKALGRSQRIFCLIVDGSPNATTRPNRDPADECYPEALRFEVDDSGSLTDQPAAEALGADVRPGQDGRRSALLKLIAGVAGLGVDELRRREHQRRQRQLAAVAATSVTAALVMSGLTLFALVSRQEAVEARQVAEAERNRAETAALRASETADFLKSLFRVADPSVSRGNSITAREILDRGVRRIDRELAGQDEVRFSLQTVLGEVYTNLGLFEQADQLLARAHVTGEQLQGADTEVLLGLLARAEVVYMRGDYGLAERLFREALERLGELGTPVDPGTRLRVLLGLGEVLLQLEQDADAAPLFEQGLTLAESSAEASPEQLARALSGSATLAFYSGEFAPARSGFLEALELYRNALGEDHPQVGQTLNQLGAVAYTVGDYEEARHHYSTALPVVERVYGVDHPEMAALLNNYARLLLESGEFETAAGHYERILVIDLAQKPHTHDDFAFTYNSLGLAKLALGECEAAEEAFGRALAVARQHEHPMHGVVLVNQSHLYCERHEWERARATLAAAEPLLETTYGRDHWRYQWMQNVQAECLLGEGRQDEARVLLESSTPPLAARWGSRLFGANAQRRLAAATDGELTVHDAIGWRGCAPESTVASRF